MQKLLNCNDHDDCQYYIPVSVSIGILQEVMLLVAVMWFIN